VNAARFGATRDDEREFVLARVALLDIAIYLNECMFSDNNSAAV